MSEMELKVAKAICERLFGPFDPNELYSQASVSWQSLLAARAAIEAMREPTEAMCDAADWQQQSAVNRYQRAIDAALND